MRVRAALLVLAVSGAVLVAGAPAIAGMTPAGAAGATAPALPTSDSAVRALVTRFLRAFEDLDLDAFTDCFAADATVFFPTPEPPERFDGRAAVREHFARVFAAIREGSKATAPPYHRLEPENLLVQPLDDDTAVVTFELHNAERIARRTLVIARRDGELRIVHLHASNVPLPTPGAAPPR